MIKLSNKLQGSGNIDLTLYVKTQGQQNNLMLTNVVSWVSVPRAPKMLV